MSTAMDSAGDIGIVSQHVVENVLETTRPQPFRCEVCNITCNSGDVLEKHKLGKKHFKSLQKSTDSSANATKMLPPPVATGTSVGELEDKKHRILQNGGSVGTMISCDICNVVCNNQEVFQEHVAGKKHSAKAIMLQASTSGVFDSVSNSSNASQKKPQILECLLCKMCYTTNELLAKHMQSKKHLKKMKESGQIPNLPFISFTSLETPPIKSVVNQVYVVKNVNSNEANVVRCDLRGITCNINDDFSRHVAEKTHQKNMEKSQIPIGPNTAPATEPAVMPEVEGRLQEERKIVTLDGSSMKGKRAESHEDVETKASTSGVFDSMSNSSSASQEKRQALECLLCKISCTSNELLAEHMQGKKHLKKMKESGQISNFPIISFTLSETPPIKPMVNQVSNVVKNVNSNEANLVRCDLCGITCNINDDFSRHVAGKKHQKNMEKSQIPIEPNTAPATEPAVMAEVVGRLQEESKIVNLDGSSMKGKRAESHEDVETKASTSGVFDSMSSSSSASQKKLQTLECLLCKISCTSNELLAEHMQGKKHLKKMKESSQISNFPLISFTLPETLPIKSMVNQVSNVVTNVDSNEAKLVRCDDCGLQHL